MAIPIKYIGTGPGNVLSRVACPCHAAGLQLRKRRRARQSNQMTALPLACTHKPTNGGDEFLLRALGTALRGAQL
jgi:hypothetical protein